MALVDLIRNSSREAVRWLGHNDFVRDRAVADWASALPQKSRVLDVGAGTCKYAHLFVHCTYTAQDHPDVDYAPPGTLQVKSDINHIPLADASFDALLCTEVLEHVEEPLRAIDEFARLLRPGGHLLVTVPAACRVHRVPTHFYGGFAPDFFKQSMVRRGFVIHELRPVGNWSWFMAQELARLPSILRDQSDLAKPVRHALATLSWPLFRVLVPLTFAAISQIDQSDDLPLGWIVHATRAAHG